MLDVIELQETVTLTGDVIARNIPYEDFLRDYDGQHVEWIQGTVIRMSTVEPRHNRLTRFTMRLLEDYLVLSGTGGEIFHDPMVMKLEPGLSGRAPDVFVVLPGGKAVIRGSDILGPADVVVEIISPGSQRQDRVDKLREYERGGVREYWAIDYSRDEALFYQRNALDLFDLVAPDADGIYHSQVLRRFALPVNILWQEFPPQGPEVTRLVEAMLALL